MKSTAAVTIVRFEKPRGLVPRAPQPTADADRRARQAVENTKKVFQAATAQTLPLVRTNSRIMASALRKLGYPNEAAQIEALAGDAASGGHAPGARAEEALQRE